MARKISGINSVQRVKRRHECPFNLSRQSSACKMGCQTENILYKKGQLAKERVNQLNKIDFLWSIRDHTWQENYKELVRYWKSHGDAKVPQSYQENPMLGKWVAHQRDAYRHNQLTQNQIDLLSQINFIWNKIESEWQERYQDLIQYRAVKGNTLVPSRYEQNLRLGKWVSKQRTRFQQGKLSEDRIELLNEIDFAWEVR